MRDIKVLRIGKDGLTEVYASNHFNTSTRNIHPHTILEPTKLNLRTYFGITERGAHHFARNKGIDTKIVICGIGDPSSCRDGEALPQAAVIVEKKQAVRSLVA